MHYSDLDVLVADVLYTEPEYTKAFLLTHHAFTSSRMVLEYLLKRYLNCSEEIEKATQAEEAAKTNSPGSPEKDDKKKEKKKKKEGDSTAPEEAGMLLLA